MNENLIRGYQLRLDFQDGTAFQIDLIFDHGRLCGGFRQRSIIYLADAKTLVSDNVVNCILDALKEGSQFSYSMLRAHHEECHEFWEWWWEQRTMEELERPLTIDDDDPILVSSSQSMFVDTISDWEFFDVFLLDVLKQGFLPRGTQIARNDYQLALVSLLVARTELLQERRVIVFSGGGYGAGKTTGLTILAGKRKLPVSIASVVGTDYFKLYLPEFARIKRVSDGRASQVVQPEAKSLSTKLFDTLVDQGRSFIWDSSMSNENETLSKLKHAVNKGYDLELVAMCSGIGDAIFRAMERAKDIRRFAHPAYLEQSHRDFSEFFPLYCPYFTKISLYHNGYGKQSPIAEPLLIADKDGMNNELAVRDEDALNRFIELGKP